MKHKLMNFSISKRQPLREEVYEILKKAILRGKIRSGQRLIEEELASALGTSRTPIREAIHKLEKDELVIKLTKGGFAVRQLTAEDIEEVLGIRSVLESYACVLATTHITSEKIRLLEKTIEKSERCLAKGDIDGLIRYEIEFHDILSKSAKSKKLHNMISNFLDYLSQYWVAIFGIRGMPTISIRDHTDMLEAMKGKNAAEFERLMKRHILRGKDIVIEQMRTGKLRL